MNLVIFVSCGRKLDLHFIGEILRYDGIPPVDLLVNTSVSSKSGIQRKIARKIRNDTSVNDDIYTIVTEEYFHLE